MTWVYMQSESSPDLFTVGFHTPNGTWVPESDHASREAAAERVAFLNGGDHYDDPVTLQVEQEVLERRRMKEGR